MKTVNLRFYEELNDFLPSSKKKVKIQHEFQYRVSIKDMIESLGVPHTEIDMILVNGKSVDFDYIVDDKDEISVYPVFESFDISDVQHLRAKPLRDPKFVLDVHLGKLARYMRMMGIDTKYENNFKDDEIVKISLDEKRTILTRDAGILKRNEVMHGFFVRNIDPPKQLKEIVERFHLSKKTKGDTDLWSEFTRCLECNTLLEKIDKSEVIEKLPEKVKTNQEEFFICRTCNKIYWKGTHYGNMIKMLKLMLGEINQMEI